MELQIDDNGNAILQDGKPLFRTQDGKDFIADVPSLHKKTLELKSEAKRNREKAESMSGILNSYQNLFQNMGVDELAEWKANADSALETVRNLSDKQLLEAGKVEQIKLDLKESHEKNLNRIKAQYQENENKTKEILEKKEKQIYELMVGSDFSNSKYFSGQNPLTILPPDAALALFGGNFKVQEDPITGKLKTVGYYNGSEILSIQPDMVGEVAPVEEAIGFLIDKYQYKERIMSGGRSGSGASGGQSGPSGPMDDIAKMQEAYQKAVTSGDVKSAITLKNKIFEKQKQKRRT